MTLNSPYCKGSVNDTVTCQRDKKSNIASKPTEAHDYLSLLHDLHHIQGKELFLQQEIVKWLKIESSKKGFITKAFLVV